MSNYHILERNIRPVCEDNEDTIGTPAVGLNPRGELSMFVLGADGVVHLQDQTSPDGAWLSGGYTQFGNPSNDEMVGDPAVVHNVDGRLYPSVRGGLTGEIRLQYQSSPGNGPLLNSGYTRFSDPFGVEMEDGPALGRDSAGYMQMFAVGSYE